MKHIAHAHGGVLRIESQLGKGTRVTVCLPAAAGAIPLPVRDATEKSVVA